MVRGTTPALRSEFPFELTNVAELWVTLKPDNNIVLDKELADCECDGAILTLRLTQQETLKLNAFMPVAIQIRMRTNDGNAVASNILTASVGQILKDGVI